MPKLYLIRHGKTEGNLKKLYYGRTDLPLSLEGRTEVAWRAINGCYPVLNCYFTTGMERTEETFSLIYGNAPHGVVEELREYEFGDYELKSAAELKDDPVHQAWLTDESWNAACPNGESNNTFGDRVMKGLKKLLPLTEDTLVVCHGGPIAMILERLFPDPSIYIWDRMPTPGGGVVIEFDGEKALGFEVLPDCEPQKK